MLWPFKWKLFGSTFAWYHLFFNILQIEIWHFYLNFVSDLALLRVIGLNLWFHPIMTKALRSEFAARFENETH